MIAYPIQISNTGGLMLSDDPERDRILALLDTRYWERVMVPDYGNPIYPFDPVDGSAGEWVAALELAMGYWIGDGIKVAIQDDPAAVEQGVIQLLIEYGNGAGQIEYRINRDALNPLIDL